MPESDPHLYEKIKETIDRRVEAEEWPAEFQVPAEVELAEEFGASPLTVRRALRELQAEGVLIRIQGRGTFVVGRRMQCAVFNISDMAEEIALSGGAHTSKLINLGVIPRDSSESNMLVLGPDGSFFMCDCCIWRTVRRSSSKTAM